MALCLYSYQTLDFREKERRRTIDATKSQAAAPRRNRMLKQGETPINLLTLFPTNAGGSAAAHELEGLASSSSASSSSLKESRGGTIEARASSKSPDSERWLIASFQIAPTRRQTLYQLYDIDDQQIQAVLRNAIAAPRCQVLGV